MRICETAEEAKMADGALMKKMANLLDVVAIQVAETNKTVTVLAVDVAELKIDVAELKTDVARLEIRLDRIDGRLGRIETLEARYLTP